jgi:hypothetical protein
MKTLIAFSLLLSFSAFADFSDEHQALCHSPEVVKLMGKKGSCQLAIAPVVTNQISSHCTGKLADLSCRVLMLKTSDSASMNLNCGDQENSLLSRVLDADVLAYNVSAVVKKSDGDYVTINDPKEYFLLSNPSLDVHLTKGQSLSAKMILTIQDKAIELTEVVCE